jgi:hypothetical protein
MIKSKQLIFSNSRRCLSSGYDRGLTTKNFEGSNSLLRRTFFISFGSKQGTKEITEISKQPI